MNVGYILKVGSDFSFDLCEILHLAQLGKKIPCIIYKIVQKPNQLETKVLDKHSKENESDIETYIVSLLHARIEPSADLVQARFYFRSRCLDW